MFTFVYNLGHFDFRPFVWSAILFHYSSQFSVIFYLLQGCCLQFVCLFDVHLFQSIENYLYSIAQKLKLESIFKKLKTPCNNCVQYVLKDLTEANNAKNYLTDYHKI